MTTTALSTVEAACESPTPGPDGVMPPAEPCNDNISVIVGPSGVPGEAWMWVGIIAAAVVLVLIALVITIGVVHAQRLWALRRLSERGSDGAGGAAGR